LLYSLELHDHSADFCGAEKRDEQRFRAIFTSNGGLFIAAIRPLCEVFCFD